MADDEEHSPLLPGCDRQLEAKRWYILAVYSLAAFCQVRIALEDPHPDPCAPSQGTVWLTFSSIPICKQYYAGVTDQTLDLLLNWGPIAFIPFVFLPMILLSRGPKGLRWTVLGGAVLTALGTLIRLVPSIVGESLLSNPNSVYFLHVGQFLNGVSGPFWMSSPSTVSSVWFAPGERTLSTSIAQLANGAGACLGFLFALPITTVSHIAALLYAEAALAVLVAICVIAYFPVQPHVPPSLSAHQRIESARTPFSVLQYLKDMFATLKNPHFVLLALSGGLQGGFFNGWNASLALILENRFSASQNQWLGFASGVATMIGSFLMGYIADRFLSRRFKSAIMFLLISALALFAVFNIMVPVAWLHNHEIVITSNYASNVAIIAIGSAVLGASNPLFYELAAETLHPAPESVSAGVIAEINNIGCLILLFVLAKVDPGWDTSVLVIALIVCVLLMVFARPSYSRSDDDEGKGEGDTLRDDDLDDRRHLLVTSKSVQ